MNSLFSRVASFAWNLNDCVNPITVKELRQAVRSRYIIILLQLYLLAEVLIVGWQFMFTDSELISNGTGLFSALMVLLCATCVVCVPVYTSIRLVGEMRDVDLLFSTSMTPFQTIWGKFVSGAVISLLLFSAAAPFLALTYLMRGLDISTIFIFMYLAFFSIQVLNCFALLFGTMNISPVLRIIIGCIIGLGILGWLADNGLFGSGSFMGSFDSFYDFMIFQMLTMQFFLFLGGTMILLAANAISPITSSRMTRLRIFLSVNIFLSLIVGGIYSYLESSKEPLIFFEIFSLFLLAIFFAIALCERTVRSKRQVLQIPKNPLLRIIEYPFFTGAGSGIVWCILMTIIIFVVDIIQCQDEGFICEYHLLNWLEPPILFFFFYPILGFACRNGCDVWRKKHSLQTIEGNPPILVYPKPIPGAASVGFAMLWFTIGALLPGIACYSFYGINFYDLPTNSSCYILNPFCYSSSSMSKYLPLVNILGLITLIYLIIFCAKDFHDYYTGSI